MDLKEILLVGLCLWQLFVVSVVSGNAIFEVEHKFKGGKRTLKELRDHDLRRHGRLLATIELPLGGDSSPTGTGLYFTKIQIGNPAKEYHVQVDTGSDMMWVHCNGCEGCPKETRIEGIKLQTYDPKSSSSAKVIKCDNQQCNMIYQRTPDNCKSDMLCQFEVHYGDGSSTSGYFVEDSINYKIAGNQSSTGNGNVVFGCGTKIGESESPLKVDGIIGFGQANSSMISQLAAAGKVKKKFSHCLDNKKGGGILAVGELVEPKLNTSPIVEKQAHYYVALKSIDVGGDVHEFSGGLFSSERGAMIDSGTTLGYLPNDIYETTQKKIFSKQAKLDIETEEGGFKCFKYSGNVDDDFPKIVLNFKGSLSLTAYPREYFFPLKDGRWCLGWQAGTFQSRDGSDVIILGDMLLQNKLVYYDLENQNIGWTEYDCSSSIKLKDDESGNVHSVAAQNLSSDGSLISGMSLLSAILLALVNMVGCF